MDRRTALITGLAGLAGCAGWESTVVPMRRVAAPLASSVRADGAPAGTLVVFLPGIYDEPEDFFRHGLIAALAESGLDCDAIAVDAHFGYVLEQSVARRLQQDVIAPARARGYRRIWFVGTSLGGLNAFLHAMHYPDVDGIVAIAPYVGSREVADEIRRAGGLRAWSAPATPYDEPPDTERQWERQLWGWLKETAERPQRALPLHLAYGNGDRFASGLSLLADVLPSTRTLVVDGGHDWTTWARLWRLWLARDGALLTASAADAR